MFLDVRDVAGIVQVVVDPQLRRASRSRTGCAASGSCASSATSRPRPDGTVNDDLPTGAVEVVAREIEVL